jgi:secreted PhoX family phosphatase
MLAWSEDEPTRKAKIERSKMKKLALLPVLLTTVALHAAPLVKSVEFTPTPIPSNDVERTTPFTRSSAVVTYADGRKKKFPLAYQTLYQSGDKFGHGQAGAIVDKHGKLIERTAEDAFGNAAQGPFFSYSPDANSLLSQQGNQAYLVTHFEYHTEAPNVNLNKPALPMYGQLPAVMNVAKVTQDKQSGQLKVVDLKNVDAASVQGIWTPCAASLTPWGTHLGGEEYEPNAREFETQPLQPMNLYLGTSGKTAQEGGANAYDYGYKMEVSVQADGATKIVKHHAMGRLSNELADVMPDNRTVYMGDDGRDTVMFMFVADQPSNLTAGTLYAARWFQQQADNGGRAVLKWVRLGHATDEEIVNFIHQGIRFSDIFESVSASAIKANPALRQSFKSIYVYAGSGSAGNQLEYLKVKPGMEKAAAFLESRRYAALLGATTEFTKMEGVTHNRQDKRLYLAMSYIEQGMIDKANEDRAADDIALEGDSKDMVCGAVYEGLLGGQQQDMQGGQISSEWVAYELRGMVTGARKPFWQKEAPQDKCDSERIANPDNLKYSEAMRTLFIGEDSGNHLNNFIWAHNIDSQQTVRIFSAPIGGENTGLQVVENWNGHSYLMANIQHPGATEDLKGYVQGYVKEVLAPKVNQRGKVGYMSGLPSFRRE